MKRACLLTIGAIYACCVFPQDIEVKKFEPLEKDQTAALKSRKDINGVTCGLVKVLLKEPGAEFEGNVMGDVQFTGNEYLVYLPNGTKRLGIKHPDYLPTTIVFADYGTKKVVSATTYELKVKTNKKQAKVDNSKKGMAIFNIKPSNAMLLIDGQIADGSGGAYTLSLPYGTHYYTVKLKDFSINNQSVLIDKNAKNINVDLTEYFAYVRVNCQDMDAEICINGELMGTGNWNGFLVPGKCVVDVSKKRCHTQSTTTIVQENDTVNWDFPALRLITGTIIIDFKPEGSDIYLNKELIGKTPLKKEIPVGEYIVGIKKEFYVDVSKSITIRDGQESTVSGSLDATPIGRVFIEANKGNYDTQMDLAYCYFYGPDKFISDSKSEKSIPIIDDNSEEKCYLPPEVSDYYDSFSVLEKNREKAWKWALKASENVTHPIYDSYYNQSALELLMHISLLSQDYSGSFKYAEKAYLSERKNWLNRERLRKNQQIHAQSSFWLAWHYYYGRGTQKNYSLAVKYMNEFREYNVYSVRDYCNESDLIHYGNFFYPEFKHLFEGD